MNAAILLTVVLASSFQQTEWGMPPAQVIQAQSIPEEARAWSEEHQGLGTYATVASREALVLYTFVDKQLTMVSVQFLETHTAKNLYLNDYQRLEAQLTAVYGPSSDGKAVWSNDLFRDAPRHHGTALSMGHLTLVSYRETSTDIIIHSIAGDNYKVMHLIVYRSKELQPLKDSKQTQQLKEEL